MEKVDDLESAISDNKVDRETCRRTQYQLFRVELFRLCQCQALISSKWSERHVRRCGGSVAMCCLNGARWVGTGKSQESNLSPGPPTFIMSALHWSTAEHTSSFVDVTTLTEILHTATYSRYAVICEYSSKNMSDLCHNHWILKLCDTDEWRHLSCSTSCVPVGVISSGLFKWKCCRRCSRRNLEMCQKVQ